MNKLFILKDIAPMTPREGYDEVIAEDLNSIAEGSFAILDEHEKLYAGGDQSIATAFRIAIGTAQGAVVTPELISVAGDFRLTIAAPVEGVKFSATITVDEVFAGEEYGFILVKKGTVANEHYKKSFSVVAKSDNAEDVINALVKVVNNQSVYTGIEAEATSNGFTLDAIDGYDDYNVVCTDSLQGAEVDITSSVKPTLDKEYVLNLIKECAADSGFRHPGMEAEKLYPGMYPELDADTYFSFSLHFHTNRVGAKPTDEKVNQIITVLVPNTYTGKTTIQSFLSFMSSTIVDAPSDLGD